MQSSPTRTPEPACSLLFDQRFTYLDPDIEAPLIANEYRRVSPWTPSPPKSRILPEITRYQSRLRYKRLEQTMFNPFGRVWSLCIRSYDTSTDSSYLSPETISIFSFCRQFLFFNKHRQRNSNCSEIQTLTIFHRAHFLRRGGEVTEGLSKGKMRRNENHSSKLDLSIAFVREFVLNN